MEFNFLSFEETAPFDGLADGEDDLCCRNGHCIILVVDRSEFTFAVEYGCALLEFHSSDLSVFCENPFRTPTAVYHHSILFCFLYFKQGSWHNVSCLKGDHGHFTASTSSADSCCIDGYVSSAYHYCFIGEMEVSCVGSLQEGNSCFSAFCPVAFNSWISSALAAYGDVEGLVSLLSKGGDGNILSYFHTRPDVDAHLSHDVDLSFDHVLFQLVGRNAVGKHSTRLFVLLEYSWIVAHLCQIEGCRQACRSGSDNCNLLLPSTFV